MLRISKKEFLENFKKHLKIAVSLRGKKSLQKLWGGRLLTTTAMKKFIIERLRWRSCPFIYLPNKIKSSSDYINNTFYYQQWKFNDNFLNLLADEVEKIKEDKNVKRSKKGT